MGFFDVGELVDVVWGVGVVRCVCGVGEFEVGGVMVLLEFGCL